MQTAKFDETVEVHFRLGLNVRHADEQLRGTLMLPHGTGKEAKVAVFAEGDKARRRRTPAPTSSARPTSRSASRRASPSSTSRSPRRPDGQRRQARAHPRPARPDAEPEDRHGDDGRRQGGARREGGKLEYRTDRGANVHVSIGKKSFEERQLVENYAALVDEIVARSRPAAKGRYIRQITLTSTMGPGITSIPRRRAASSTSWRDSPKQYLHKRPSPKTGSSRKAEAFPRRIGEPRFPPPFSEPALRAGSNRSRR
jgi:large subunit ribosomal protein L1